MSEVISNGIAITCSDWTQSQHLLKQLKDEPWIQTSPPIQNQKPSIRGDWLTTCYNMLQHVATLSWVPFGSGAFFSIFLRSSWRPMPFRTTQPWQVGKRWARWPRWPRWPGNQPKGSWPRWAMKVARRGSQLCSWWSRGVILATAQYS